ncbi:MAG: ABC transporter permease subunit [Planctomycetaceae bacterium]
MLAGPIFSREALTSPRQLKHFLIRAGYVGALFIMMYTAGQATFGWQQVRYVGEVAKFGGLAFQLFSVVQLSLVLFFALIFAAGSVAQEKDRQTLILLLMTDLRNRELVLGKLFASLLMVAVLLATSVPVLAFIHLLGGVTIEQVGWTLAVSAATALAAGSWGLLVAYWREKTFQTLAISVLGVVLALGLVEAVVLLAPEGSALAHWAGLLNPYRTLAGILDPLSSHSGLEPISVSAWDYIAAMGIVAVAINLYTGIRLRVWNPSRTTFTHAGLQAVEEAERTAVRPAVAHRSIWNNPVIWREIRTKAYGRKILAIKAVYVIIAAFAGWSLIRSGGSAGSELVLGMISPAGFAFVGLGLVSLMLINAQAVTSLTNERDGKTLELLLMTDISAKEFIFGKLGGILYNTKELVLIPLVLIGYFVVTGNLGIENLLFVAFGYFVLVAFASMLGLHSGLSYDSSRAAIANSLGTIFFLFIGIFIFMILLLEARSSFAQQFASFLVFILAGSMALYASLSHKNPSNALKLAAGVLPFLTFYAITEFLLKGSLGVCLAISAAYGFTTLAMMIPAVSEFDVALGRTTLDKG